MPSDLLSIVMPLKGRPLHTLRFLWHANEVRLPYRILIADGEVHLRIAELLENPSTFPNLSIEYVRYPDDATYTRFFAKMADAMRRVHTPYVKIVDNDDFLGPAGVDRCLAFLEQHPDYVCCGGGLAGFALDETARSVVPQVTGRVNRYSYRYSPSYRSRDLAADSVAERVVDAYRYYKTTFYDVFRADALRTIWRECLDIDFSDLVLMEYFCALRAMTLGKSRSEGTAIFYLRQYGTSMPLALRKDWARHLAHSRFTADLDAVVKRISALAGAPEGQAAVDAELRNITANWLRQFLKSTYGMNVVTVKEALHDHVPDWIIRIRRWRHLAVARERRAMFDRLRADGATDSYIETFRGELAAIERSLGGDAFVAFVRRHAPELLTERS